jgi:hypothetical protein
MKLYGFRIVGHVFLSLNSPPLPQNDMGILCDALGGLPLLVDEHGNKQDGDDENNAKDDNDTRLTLGPVVALGELVESVLGASGEGHADGGHCVCRFLREKESDGRFEDAMRKQVSRSSKCSKTEKTRLTDGRTRARRSLRKGLGKLPKALARVAKLYSVW